MLVHAEIAAPQLERHQFGAPHSRALNEKSTDRGNAPVCSVVGIRSADLHWLPAPMLGGACTNRGGCLLHRQKVASARWLQKAPGAQASSCRQRAGEETEKEPR